MARRKRLRKVVAPPQFKGYRPFGLAGNRNGSVDLLYEEYEAIKLADYDLMNHQEAAKVMGISRPTFARIYETARRKIAQAFVEAREIRTIYGNAWMDKNWYICGGCHARFTIPDTHQAGICPICKTDKVSGIN